MSTKTHTAIRLHCFNLSARFGIPHPCTTHAKNNRTKTKNHTTVHTRALAAIILASTLFLLSGCRSESQIAIQPSGAIDGMADVTADFAIASTAGIACSKLEEIGNIKLKGGIFDNESSVFTVEDHSDSNTFHCTLTFNSGESAAGTQLLSETETSYIFSLPRTILNEGNLRALSLLDPQFSLSIAMPGKIISAPGATINANTATFSDIDALRKGVNVEGEKTPAKENEANTPQTITKVNPADIAEKPTRSNYFIWALSSIGILTVLVLGIGIYRHRAHARTYTSDSAEPSTASTNYDLSS